MASGRYARAKSWALVVLIAISLVPFIAGISLIVSKLYPPLAGIGQQGMLLGMGCALSGLLIFIFGIFYTINIYYFAQDLEFLLPLPLKPGQILGAKFTVTLVFEFLTQLIILAPLLVTYGIVSGAGANYYLIAAIVFLSLPVIPLVLASLLSIVLMSYSSIVRYKDRFRIWVGGLGLVAALSMQFSIQKLMGNKKPEELILLVQQGKNSLVDLVMRIFPGVNFAVHGLLQEGMAAGWLYTLAFLGLTALFILVLQLAGGTLYFRGAVGGSESYAARRLLSEAEIAATGRSSQPLKALIVREFRLLVRTPAFFMNCVIINFIWPIMLLFINASGEKEDIEGMQKLLGGGVPWSTLLMVGLGVTLFIAGSSGASASGISREGSQFFVGKYLPVDYRTQIKAKMAVAFLLAFGGYGVLLTVIALGFHLPAGVLSLSLLLALPGVAFPVLMGMILDIQFPKLIWDNEYRAVKQNLNIMVLMVISGLAGALCILVALRHGEWGWPLVAGAAGIILLLNAGLYLLLHKKGADWIASIDA
jgi:ABC-2 type transport system permease protein